MRTQPPTKRLVSPPGNHSVLRCKVCAKRMRLEEEQTKVFYGGGCHAVCCPSCAAKFEAFPGNYIEQP